jgi:hypothetical protein
VIAALLKVSRQHLAHLPAASRQHNAQGAWIYGAFAGGLDAEAYATRSLGFIHGFSLQRL